MKKNLLTLLFVCTAFFASSQTTWQWGRSGGSKYSTDVSNINPVSEWITSMATDPNGNVYALAQIARDKVYTGKDSSKPFNNSSIVRNYAFMSWACNGSLRWIKTIGPALVREVVTDTLGGVYLMGQMNVAYGNNFDTDTIIAPQGPNVLNGNFIIKYDTTGHVKWLSMPDPNAVTPTRIYGNPEFHHIQAMPNGDLYTLCYLPTGVHADGGYTVSKEGVHILKYNKDGNFVSGTRLAINLPLTSTGPDQHLIYGGLFNRDAKTGRYYLSGSLSRPDELNAGNDTLRGGTMPTIFVCSFDPSGNLEWARVQDTADMGTVNSTALDAQGNFYLGGQIFSGSHWNGTPITAPAGTPYWWHGKLGMGYVACMDSNGVNKWVSTCYDTTSGRAYPTCLTVSKNNVVKAGGIWGTRLTWGAHSRYDPTPQPCGGATGFTYSGTGTFFANLDAATGNCTGLDTLNNKCGYVAAPNLIVTDRNNNFFIGGSLGNYPDINDTVTTIGPDKMVTIGGTTDFFVAKYGVASCKTAQTGVSKLPLSGLQIYPNPAATVFNISGSSTSLGYTLYNNMGSSVLSGNLSGNPSTVNVAQLPTGLYYLQLGDHAGATAAFKIVKE